MDSLDQQKRELRALLKARMPAGEALVAASVAAQERLAASELVARASMIALYRALPFECGTAVLATALEAAGKSTCYPVVVPGVRALQFRRGVGVFAAGAFGIEEPTGSPVALSEIDLLVVPAVAVDAAGGRLGRGKGFYDATLAVLQKPSVALVFEVQLVERVPVGEHDRPVSAVCTERRIVIV